LGNKYARSRVQIPAKFDFAGAEASIESVCAAHGLELTMKTSLANFPGSIHWHYENKREKGTLELTVFPRDRRIWAQVQSGRKAPWIEIVLPRVQKDIERKLRLSRHA
jgi:hypothetical protein